MQRLFKVTTYASDESDIAQLKNILTANGFGNTKTNRRVIDNIDTVVLEIVCTKRQIKKVTNLVIDAHKFDFPYLEVRELSKTEEKEWLV